MKYKGFICRARILMAIIRRVGIPMTQKSKDQCKRRQNSLFVFRQPALQRIIKYEDWTEKQQKQRNGRFFTNSTTIKCLNQ